MRIACFQLSQYLTFKIVFLDKYLLIAFYGETCLDFLESQNLPSIHNYQLLPKHINRIYNIINNII